MSTVSSTTSSSSTTTLSQKDFLTLLAKQMTNQDPLDPQSDTSFLAELAQFSALEETQTISENVSTMKTNQEVAEASSLLGKTVSITSDSSTVSGTVSSVAVDSDTVNVMVNSSSYPVSDITAVQETTTSE
jgi:flagellar basal-body rod modification protein FlgD